MGIKEQTLLNSMNGMIRKDIEEKEKERERDAAREGSSPQADFDKEFALTSADAQIEKLLVKSIVRDGEKVIYENVETEDGEKVNLTVAQYIAYDLGQDGLTFSDERYNQILQEAAAHSGEEGFKAEPYFMQHPDFAISSLAAELAIDRHQLGRGFQLKEREGGLRQHVLHLVLDLRMDIVENRLKELKAEMRQVGSDMARIKALMEEFKETQELRNALAQQLGNDLVG
jgi:DNA primase